MVMAIEARELQQQQLADQVCQEILAEAKLQPEPKVFLYRVTKSVMVIAGHYYTGSGGPYDGEDPAMRQDVVELDDETDDPAGQQAYTIAMAFLNFAKTETEFGVLYWRLLEKLQAETVGKLQTLWQHQCLMEPERALGTSTSNGEIAMPRELVA